jgi:enoyl-CoA hydratase/carnithine racemase
VTTAASRAGTDVELRVRGAVAEIVIGDGSKGNALTRAGWRRVEDTVREAGRRDGIHAVLFRGRHGNFCSGSDLTEWIEADRQRVDESFAAMESAFRAVEQCPAPTIADVRGVAAGAGCQLALSCDLRYMAESARIGMPIARLGILVSPSFTARITALAGPGIASEILYTGNLLDAATAVSTGLANAAVPDADLDAFLDRLLSSILRHPPNALRAAKRSLQAVLTPLRSATDLPISGTISEPDFRTGIRAVLRRE